MIVLLPGLIDPHVHLRDPGSTEKEDFYTGTCAALAGGFTTVLDMPNNKVPITTFDRLKEKINQAKKKIVCDIGFYFGSLGDNLDEFKKINTQVFGIKLYLNLTTGGYLIGEEKLENIYDAWISVLSSSRMRAIALQRGSNKQRHVMNWIPAYAGMTHNLNNLPILVHSEEQTFEAVLAIVKKTGKKTHLCHLSSGYELKRVIEAKHDGLPITCGVSPHYLFLTEDDVKSLGTYAKMKPPLKTKKDKEFLWKNLQYIDVLESDHAPHTIEEKHSANPPFGIPGLETTLPLMLTEVNKNRITIDEVLRLCFYNPAKIFNVPTDKKTYVEVDMNESYVIENKNLKTKCGWSPFSGRKVKGKVKKVFIRGERVYENGEILVKPGFGKVLKPYSLLTSRS